MMKKRIVSLLLALVLCLSLLPTAALAEGTTIEVSKSGDLIDQGTYMEGKTFKLTQDIKLSESLTIGYYLTKETPVNTTIDLNGHVLSAEIKSDWGSSPVIQVMYGSTLTLTDSDPTAVHYFTEGADGRWSLCTTEGCAHTTCHKVEGGCIVGSDETYCVELNQSNFVMEGGNLIGGKVDVSAGGLSLLSGSTAQVKGGSIQGCVGGDGGVSVRAANTLKLGGDSDKTVTIANNKDNSGSDLNICLSDAYNNFSTAKLTVGEMASGSSYTAHRKIYIDWQTSKVLPYIHELDLTEVTDDVSDSSYSWDNDKNELTLTNVVCGTVKLPYDEPKDTTIKGNGYAEWVGCSGNASGKLIFDDADLEIGSIMWCDAYGEDDHAVVLQNDSHLTVSGEDGMHIGALDIEDTSELTLKNSKIMSLFEDRINELKDYLADNSESSGYGATQLDPENSRDYTLTKDGNTATNETFRHYCAVNFHAGTSGKFEDESTQKSQRVPYGSTVTDVPTPTPTNDNWAFDGWIGIGTTNGQVVDMDVKTTDKIEDDKVDFTAKWTRAGAKTTLTYTNTVKKGGTVAPTAEQQFELEIFYNRGEEPTPSLSASSSTTLTTFPTGNQQVELTGNMTIRITDDQLANAFPCFVRQKTVTALGWTSASEVWALVYETAESGGQGRSAPLARGSVPGSDESGAGGDAGGKDPMIEDPDEQEDEPKTITLKIYPAELVDGKYQIKENAEAVEKMTFTNTYTSYSVSWSAGYVGGSLNYTGATTSGAVGTTIIPPTSDPTRDNYTFDGWYNSMPYGTKLTKDTKIGNSNVTYYAHWKPITYTVTFNSAGGSDVSPQKVEYSKKATKPTDPTREGWQFRAWYTDSACTNAYDFNTSVTSDITLYAGWDRTYNVTWDGAGGTVDTTGATLSGIEGAPIVKPTNDPTRAADANYVYEFAGWYTAAEGGDALTNASVIPQGGATYYAHWNKTPIYTVTFDAQGGSAVSPQKVVSGSKASEPTAPTKSGYTFGGWYTDETLKTAYDFETTVTGNRTLYARWIFNIVPNPSYVVTVSETEHGTIEVSPRYAVCDGTVTITVTPDAGYKLGILTVVDEKGNEVKLTEKGNGVYSFRMPEGGASVKARFVRKQTISFVDVPKGAYFFDAVQWAVENGITSGVDETHFDPNGSCTRAQLVTFLWRAAGCPVVDEELSFNDVGRRDYFAEAVRWAASKGIVKGYDATTFGANDIVTREQVASIIYRFVQTQGNGFSGAWAFRLNFEDVSKLSDWAVEGVSWCVMNDIMQGYNNNLSPKEECTRAQIVTMLYRLLG